VNSGDASAGFAARLYGEWGHNVRQARGRSWSQHALAAAAGISPSHLGNLETGRRAFTVQVMCRLAGALRRPVGELFPWPARIPPFPGEMGAP